MSLQGNLSPRGPRRAFLRIGLAGALLGPLVDPFSEQLRGEDERRPSTRRPPRAKNVVVLFLTGGPATIDLWDLKPDAPEAIRGEFLPIDTSAPGIRICEYMPELARLMHQVALVRSVSHTIAEHTQGQAYLLSGNRPSPPAESPAMGSLAATLLPSERGTPNNIQVGRVPYVSTGELGAAYQPLEVALTDAAANGGTADTIGLPAGFSGADLERRRSLLESVDARFAQLGRAPVNDQLAHFRRDALDLLQSDKIRVVLDVNREPESVRQRYGDSPVGRGALLARRFVEAGAHFITVGFGDWDTHDNHFPRMRNSLVPQLDHALSALLTDLADRGLLDETIVYCAGEFGRTPTINASAGRDHWSRAMTVLLAGGGIRAGCVVGATDALASEPVDRPCSPDDVSATIFRQLGFEPQRRVIAPGGRELPLFRNGKVLSELI